jgi:hypothetical protein
MIIAIGRIFSKVSLNLTVHEGVLKRNKVELLDDDANISGQIPDSEIPDFLINSGARISIKNFWNAMLNQKAMLFGMQCSNKTNK